MQICIDTVLPDPPTGSDHNFVLSRELVTTQPTSILGYSPTLDVSL